MDNNKEVNEILKTRIGVDLFKDKTCSKLFFFVCDSIVKDLLEDRGFIINS